MHNTTPAVSHLSLTEVQSQFAAWRNSRTSRERIPEALWSAALKLCENHSIHKVSKALRLNHTNLRDRVAVRHSAPSSAAIPCQDFIAIEMEQPRSSECIIEMEHRNGNRMRMHFKGQADLDLQSFADSFWT